MNEFPIEGDSIDIVANRIMWKLRFIIFREDGHPYNEVEAREMIFEELYDFLTRD